MTISLAAFLLLATILSIDTFTAGLSYTAQKVRVPLLSILIISCVSGFTFTLSLFAGQILIRLLPLSLMKVLSFLLLLSLALYKLYDALPERLRHPLRFTTAHISEAVNREDIPVLSPKEAFFLSLLLSADSISAGLSTAPPPLPVFSLFFLTSLIHLCALFTGMLCGRLLLQHLSCNLSLLGALLLLILAFLRLF